jgi:hypothetical protein
MGAWTTEIHVQEWGIGDRIIRQEIVQMTINHGGSLKIGLSVKLVKVLVKQTIRRETLTMNQGHNSKVSWGIRDDRGIHKNVKSLSANGIDAKTIIEAEVVIKKIVDGAGRHHFEVVFFFGHGGGIGQQGDTRRKSRR